MEGAGCKQWVSGGAGGKHGGARDKLLVSGGKKSVTGSSYFCRYPVTSYILVVKVW